VKPWAHTYIAGAVSGTALIVAAIVAFVPLVSLQALHEWPASGLGPKGGGSRAGESGGATAGAKHAVPGLSATPSGDSSVVTRGAAGTTGTAGKGRHAGGTGSPAHGAAAISPALASPVVGARASHPPVGSGPAPSAAPSAPPAVSTGAGGHSDSAVKGDKGKGGGDPAGGPSPALASPVAGARASHPPAGSGPALSALSAPSAVSTRAGGHSNSAVKGGRSGGRP
jgi:hypothetical protein